MKAVVVLLLCLGITFGFEVPHNRTKRFLVFPPGSATGVLIALAIPLDLPHRAVFVSYNFESNYSPPVLASDYTQSIIQKVSFRRKESKNSQLRGVSRSLLISKTNFWKCNLNI